MKTVRFSQLVARCGEPHAHTLWVAPEQDGDFQHALKSERVLTIEHEPGKTDFGIVGFDARKNKAREFLIFPKSLRRFKGARVVGIKFDLVSQPRQIQATRPARAVVKRRRAHHRSRHSGATHAAPHANPRAAEPARTAHSPVGRPVRAEIQHGDTKLRLEVRRALIELAAGKDVAAYHRLERAISPNKPTS